MTQEADPEAPVRAARAFMTAIIAADRAGWAPLARPPVAWNRRCAWQQDEAAVDRVVRSQRPPPGVVAVQSARILAKVDPAANTRAADAHRALADLATTCGSPSLDAPLGALRGLAHRFVLVQLRTPDGPHPVVLRLTRVGGDWRVTGLIG